MDFEKTVALRDSLREIVGSLQAQLFYLNHEIAAVCRHADTKEKKVYHEGDYYNMSWNEIQVICNTCGKLVSSEEEKGSYGSYA